jgi:hypothetical protein
MVIWKEGYGHNIVLLWDAFKRRQPAPGPVEFDAIVWRCTISRNFDTQKN